MHASHRETLRAPGGWWLITGFLAFTFVVAVWAILDLTWAAGAAVLFGGLVALVLTSYGRARLLADDSGLQADRAHIDWQWVGGARALDKQQTRQAIADAADGRAWILIRPYLDTAVMVEIDDSADPYDRWVLSTRHPELLAAAINEHLPAPAARGDRD